MAASETVTEKSLRNSARNGKLDIISPVEVRLGSKWASGQRLILKNRMKSVENKVILKCQMTGLQSLIFMNLRTIF